MPVTVQITENAPYVLTYLLSYYLIYVPFKKDATYAHAYNNVLV